MTRIEIFPLMIREAPFSPAALFHFLNPLTMNYILPASPYGGLNKQHGRQKVASTTGNIPATEVVN